MKQTLWRLGAGDAGVGRLLALERDRRGISQTALARTLGVSQANLSRIEHGADLRVSTLLEIARALGLEPMLVPKEAAGAVRSLIDDVVGGSETPERGRFA